MSVFASTNTKSPLGRLGGGLAVEALRVTWLGGGLAVEVLGVTWLGGGLAVEVLGATVGADAS